MLHFNSIDSGHSTENSDTANILQNRQTIDTQYAELTAFIIGIVALLKGFHLPGLWAATQAQIDYSQGIIKRGLFGEIARFLNLGIHQYTNFATLSLILLIIFAVLLCIWIKKCMSHSKGDGGLILILFSSSFILSYIAHLIGYLDIPLLCLALGALFFKPNKSGLLFICLIGAIGVLIHEAYLILFLPITLLPLFQKALLQQRPYTILTMMAAVTIKILAIVYLIAFHAPTTPDYTLFLIDHTESRTDFTVRKDFFAVLHRSTWDNIQIMLNYMGKLSWWKEHLSALIIFLPTISVFLWVALRVLGNAYNGWRLNAARLAVLVASLSPLFMHLLGWDLFRWYALSGFTSFLAMSLTIRFHLPPSTEIAFSGRARSLFLLLIALNMAAGTGLMDGLKVQTLPFEGHIQTIDDILSTGGRLRHPKV